MEQHTFGINDLEAVLVSEGPGSYTGLRIAASGVKGLLFDSDVPLYGAQTLASFACAALDKVPYAFRIHSIIDARRVHVYHCVFEVTDGALTAEGEAKVIPVELFEKMVQPDDTIIGTGLNRLAEDLVSEIRCFDKEHISACSLINLYQRKEAANFIHKVSVQNFDPKYYTSNQAQ